MARKDILQALIVVFLWGLNFVWIRIGLNGVPPLLLCVLRFALSAFPAVFFLPKPTISHAKLFSYGFTIFGLQFAFLFTGMHVDMSAGMASLVLQSQAFFTMALAAWFLHERASRWKIIGALISFSGVAMIAWRSGGDVTLAGLAFTLLAALSWGIGNTISKTLGKGGSLALVVWGSLYALPLLALASLWLEGIDRISDSMSNFSFASTIAIACIVYLSTYVGYTFWVSLLSRYAAATVAPFTLLVPVFGIFGAAIFLGETVFTGKAIASAIVILGLCFNLFEPGGRRALANHSALRRNS